MVPFEMCLSEIKKAAREHVCSWGAAGFSRQRGRQDSVNYFQGWLLQGSR
jgi:hypothetical protein